MKTIQTALLFCLIALLSLTGCAPQASAQADLSRRAIQVVATTGMVADLARAVGGERVQVRGLMGAGVDPHLYKPTEGDVIALQEADLIFYSGLHLEAGMNRALERMAERRPVVAVTQAIDPALLRRPPEFEGAYDPHVWFDVALWAQTIDVARDALIQLDPGSRELYTANAERYHAELQTLDDYVRAQAERIPASQRVLITAHDAFGYFGDAYGFEVRGLQGISTESEAGAANVRQLAQFIADRRIPALFIESSVPRRNIEAVLAAVNARGWQAGIGGELFSDALGDADTPEGTYIGMVRHNIDTITLALLGQEQE